MGKATIHLVNRLFVFSDGQPKKGIPLDDVEGVLAKIKPIEALMRELGIVKIDLDAPRPVIY